MSQVAGGSACPACAGREAECVAGRAALLEELEALWEFRTRRLRPGVPPERLVDRLIFTQPPPQAVIRCRTCGTLRRDPPERGAARKYAEDPTGAAVVPFNFGRGRRLQRRRVRRLTALNGGPGRGLEIGPYDGTFLAEAVASGWRFEGVDVNPRVVRHLCQRGLRVRCGGIEDVPGDRAFDAVAIWNCFEQLEDPPGALRLARTRLRPGGVLALRTPNGAFYGALRSRLAGRAGRLARALLAHSNLLGFPYLYAFNPGALEALLRAHGFRMLSISGDALVPLADEWTRAFAGAEEQVVRLLMRTMIRLAGLAGRGAAFAPWLEVYARV